MQRNFKHLVNFVLGASQGLWEVRDLVIDGRKDRKDLVFFFFSFGWTIIVLIETTN